MKRIAIVCNGLAPPNGLPVSAQGVRVLGLFQGLRAHGIPVDIVARTQSVKRQIERFGPSKFRSDPTIRIIEDSEFEKVLNSEYSTIIVSNWPALRFFRKSDKVQLIYDFFSPTLVEHSFFESAEVLETKALDKKNLIEQADAVIANSHRISKYSKNYLQNNIKIKSFRDPVVVRLSQNWSGPCVKDSTKLKVFIGGYKQFWSSPNFHIFNSISPKAKSVEFISIGASTHYFKYNSKLDVEISNYSENISINSTSDFYSFNKINRECGISIDVFEENRERILSYSTRCISSLSNGCPVLTMSFTEIGGLIEETGAGWTLDSLSENEILQRLNSLTADKKQLDAAQGATRDFWERYCNPVDQAERLLEVLNV